MKNATWNEGLKKLISPLIRLLCMAKKENVSESESGSQIVNKSLEKNRKTFSNDIFMLKNNRNAIFEKINNERDTNTVINEIEECFENFKLEYDENFDLLDDILDDKNRQSLMIIQNIIKQHGLKTSRELAKFKSSIENDWTITKIREELAFKLLKILRELIDKLLHSIINGIKEYDSYYSIVEILNNLLSQLGVYTVDVKQGDKISNFDLLEPQITDNNKTNDVSLENKIKEVFNLPYLFNDELVILEAKVVIWKLER